MYTKIKYILAHECGPCGVYEVRYFHHGEVPALFYVTQKGAHFPDKEGFYRLRRGKFHYWGQTRTSVKKQCGTCKKDLFLLKDSTEGQKVYHGGKCYTNRKSATECTKETK